MLPRTLPTPLTKGRSLYPKYVVRPAQKNDALENASRSAPASLPTRVYPPETINIKYKNQYPILLSQSMGAYNLMKQPWQPTSPVAHPPPPPPLTTEVYAESGAQPTLQFEETKPRRVYIIILDDFLTVPSLQLAADTVRTLTEHLTKVDKEDDTADYDILVKYTPPEMDELAKEASGCMSVNFFVITGKITTLQVALNACRDACPQVPKSFVSLHEGSQVSYFKHLLRQWGKDGSYPFSCEALQMTYKE